MKTLVKDGITIIADEADVDFYLRAGYKLVEEPDKEKIVRPPKK